MQHNFQKIWKLLNILRVSRSETWLTVYRALYMIRRIGVSSISKSNTEAFWGGQGVFGLAAIGKIDKQKI